MADLPNFIAGAIAMGFLTCALFFLRFWKRTRDALFVSFAIAFSLLGIAQSILALGNIPEEERSWVYLIRLAAFAVIIVSIMYKNRGARR